jgi:hypothetical protein
MTYRAILIDPSNLKLERPVQIYGRDRKQIDTWAHSVLGHAVSPDAHVEIYETVETRVDTIKREGSSA